MHVYGQFCSHGHHYHRCFDKRYPNHMHHESKHSIAKYQVAGNDTNVELDKQHVRHGNPDIVYFKGECHYNTVNNRHKEYFKGYNIHNQHP